MWTSLVGRLCPLASYTEREDFAARRGVLRFEQVDHHKSDESIIELASLLSCQRHATVFDTHHLVNLVYRYIMRFHFFILMRLMYVCILIHRKDSTSHWQYPIPSERDSMMFLSHCTTNVIIDLHYVADPLVSPGSSIDCEYITPTVPLPRYC